MLDPLATSGFDRADWLTLLLVEIGHRRRLLPVSVIVGVPKAVKSSPAAPVNQTSRTWVRWALASSIALTWPESFSSTPVSRRIRLTHSFVV